MIEYYWSRKPGKFVDKTNGEGQIFSSFNGSVREWYETLVEVTIDLHNQIERIHGREEYERVRVFTNGNVGIIYECSVLFKPVIERSEIGEVRVGRICDRLPLFLSRDAPRDEIHFVDPDGTILGKIHVLDI